jgi:predicted transcriptional regulator
MAITDHIVLATLDAIRAGASTDYADRVPQATRDNITAVGNAITEYTTLTNEFTNALIGKIGKTIVSSKLATNVLAPFKSGKLYTGSDVEEIFLEMLSATNFDETGATPMARKQATNTKIMYHRQDRQDEYKVTISHAQVQNAFHSLATLEEFINKQIEAMYSGANYDEFILMKNILAGGTYKEYEVEDLTEEAHSKAFVKTVRKAMADIKFVSTDYNVAGVKTFTDPKDAVLIVNKDVIASTSVDVLAGAFNLGKVDFEPKIVVVDNFGTLADTFGVLIDRNFFRVFDTKQEVASIFNPQGLFTNYYFHVWQILSRSNFTNAVKFTKTTRA